MLFRSKAGHSGARCAEIGLVAAQLEEAAGKGDRWTHGILCDLKLEGVSLVHLEERRALFGKIWVFFCRFEASEC